MGYWDKQTPNKLEPEEPEIGSLEEFEAAALSEVGDVEAGFRERMKKENQRFRDMCDTEYWFCVCFSNRAQKEEFLRKIGMEPDLKYVDGRDMAKAYKKALKSPDMDFAQVRPFDKEYLDRTRQS